MSTHPQRPTAIAAMKRGMSVVHPIKSESRGDVKISSSEIWSSEKERERKKRLAHVEEDQADGDGRQACPPGNMEVIPLGDSLHRHQGDDVPGENRHPESMNNHAKHQSKRNEPLERQVDSYQTQPRIGEQEGFWDMVENDRPQDLHDGDSTPFGDAGRRGVPLPAIAGGRER